MRKYLVVLALSIFCLAATAQEKFNLEDFNKKYSFSAKSFGGVKSMNDGKHYTFKKGNKIEKASFKSGKTVATVVDLTDNDVVFGGYSFSNDESKLLLTTKREMIYRHSYTAEYYVYNVETKSVEPLSENGRQQLASFSPDGTKVAFVRKNNIFIKNLITGKEKQVTLDGKFNFILNGAPDWVYEEEFAFSKAYAWDPSSKFISYLKFDESDVRNYNMNKFSGTFPEVKENKLYPENYSFKYPKAGEKNSIVTLHVYNLESSKTIKIDTGKEKDQYIPRINWSETENQLVFYRLNRIQNHLEIFLADAISGKLKLIYEENNDRYISEENFDNLVFFKDKKHFIFSNEKSGFNHIYLYNMEDNSSTPITSGDFDVSEFLGYNKKKKLVYYLSSERSPMQRDLYSVKVNGSKKKLMSSTKGTNRVVFSKNFSYYINFFSNVNTPNIVTINNAKGKVVRTLEDNKNLVEKLKAYKVATKEFFTFKTSEDVELNVWMIKPTDFDASKKYPILLYQYSGPGSQSVKNSWSLDWYQCLAQEGYIVACVDGRGTGSRGEEFKKVTYKELGKYETIDQIETAKYFAKQSYINPARIGIWGWSFGGYISSSCMVKGNGIFKMAMAVAPVTSWRYYDSIYTERFMQTPQLNPSGYDDNSPINYTKDFKGKLLLVHGTSDDNVHVQNTYEFAERLVQADKDFDMLIYNNRNHSIYGGNTRNHLFRQLFNYVKTNL